MAHASIVLENVTVDFGGYHALQNLSFGVPEGQFAAIVGPTGCGKTSVLNMVAGLAKAASGQVRCGGRLVDSVQCSAAYMFQQDALLPWKTVLENVLLGPLLRGAARRDAETLARHWIARVGLKGLEARYPAQLSGGQRKRVAMAQALICGLPVLLLDEPFSALDAQTRVLMEEELLTLWQEQGATVLFVTHDLEEAISLADRVLIFSAGPGSRLKADYRVDLPRPRNVVEARFIPGFMDLYRRIWADLKEEVLASHERSKASA